jgi:multicomponent Na+:H+ antiporter subunit G
MGMIFDVVSWTLLLIGSFFSVVGGIGLIRLPDFYARGHAAGVTDTMGAGCILLGLCLQTDSGLVVAKMLFILVFIVFTSPTASHALGKGAYLGGVKPQTKTLLNGSALDKHLRSSAKTPTQEA